jgi:hypothetical protein
MLNFETIKGDTFNEVPFEVLRRIDINTTEPISLAGAVIRMQLRKEPCSVALLSFTSVNNAGITITNGANGQFKINEQIINIQAGRYYYDIEIRFSDNTVKTWVNGYFTVKQDITR